MADTSPTPWHYLDGSHGVYSGSKAVCTVAGWRGRRDPLRDANAALIVRAVNDHEALRAALANVASIAEHFIKFHGEDQSGQQGAVDHAFALLVSGGVLGKDGGDAK